MMHRRRFLGAFKTFVFPPLIVLACIWSVYVYVYVYETENSNSELGSLLRQDPCTLESSVCFDYSRCHRSDNLTISIYPKEPPEIQIFFFLRPGKTSKWFLNILEIVKSSRFYVEDPADACLLIPSFDHSLVESEQDLPWAINRKLRSLKYWEHGRNHLLFSKHDRGGVQYPVENAIVSKVGWSWKHFRPGFDVSMPPPCAWYSGDRRRSPLDGWELWEKRMKTYEETGSFANCEDLEFLATFKGGFTHPLRRQLVELNNESDIVYVHASQPGNYNYLLLNTQFALAPRGNGFYSYRLMESIAAGAIPVIISDGYVLPFYSEIAWSSFSVIVPEREWKRIPQILRSIPDSRIYEMRKNMHRVWTKYFASLELQVLKTLEILEKRIHGG